MPWSKAAEKLLDLTNNQLSRFSNASLIVKDAKAKAEANRILAQSEHDAEKIKKGELTYNDFIDVTPSKAVLIIPNESEQKELTYDQRVLASFAHQEGKKDENIQKVFARATEIILNSPKDDIGEVDEDLVSRIIDESQFASKEDLQKLWGQILANTILKPQDVSVDLIDFMRRITNQRAKDIELIAPYVIDDMIVKTQSVEDISKGDLSFWLKMQNLGIISGVGAAGLNKIMNSNFQDRFQNFLIYGEKIILINGNQPDLKIHLNAYVVSELGMQVLSLVSVDNNYSYFNEVAQNIKSRHPDLDVSIANITSKNLDGTISYQILSDFEHNPRRAKAGAVEED